MSPFRLRTSWLVAFAACFLLPACSGEGDRGEEEGSFEVSISVSAYGDDWIRANALVDGSGSCDEQPGGVELAVGEERRDLSWDFPSCVDGTARHSFVGSLRDPGGRVEGDITLRDVRGPGTFERTPFSIPEPFEVNPVAPVAAEDSVAISWFPAFEGDERVGFLWAASPEDDSTCPLGDAARRELRRASVEPGGVFSAALSGEEEVVVDTSLLGLGELEQPCLLPLHVCRTVDAGVVPEDDAREDDALQGKGRILAERCVGVLIPIVPAP